MSGTKRQVTWPNTASSTGRSMKPHPMTEVYALPPTRSKPPCPTVQHASHTATASTRAYLPPQDGHYLHVDVVRARDELHTRLDEPAYEPLRLGPHPAGSFSATPEDPRETGYANLKQNKKPPFSHIGCIIKPAPLKYLTMTIHTDWPRVLHEECPEAFSARTPKHARVGFVDGHLQLMRLHPLAGSWSNFAKFQFIKPLQMLLDA